MTTDTYSYVHQRARGARYSASMAADQITPDMGEVDALLIDARIESLETEAEILEDWLASQ